MQDVSMQNYAQNQALCKKYVKTVPETKVPQPPVPSVQTQAQTQDTKNDTVELKEKDNSKKAKIAKIALLTATCVAAAAFLEGAFSGNKLDKQIRQFIRKHEDVFNFSKFKATLSENEQVKKLSKVSNIVNNSNTVKDSFSLPVIKRIPVLRKITGKVSDIYTKASLKTTKAKYIASKQAADSAIDELQNLTDKTGAKDKVKTLIEKLQKTYGENFNSELTENRLKDIQQAMQEDGTIAKKTRSSFVEIGKKLLNKNTRKEAMKTLSDGVIIENLAAKKKEEFVQPLEKGYKDIKGIWQEIFDTIKEENGESWLKENEEKLLGAKNKYTQKLKSAIQNECNEHFNKIRDIEAGGAETDIITMGLTAGAMGVYLAQADDKNQRVEVGLTSGVPLMVALLTATIGANKQLSGFKSAVLGLLTGEAAKLIGEAANKKYQARHGIKEQKINIPTLNSTKEEIKNGAQKIKKRANEKLQGRA